MSAPGFTEVAPIVGTPMLLAAIILVPLLGAAFTVTVPAAERRLVRVVSAMVGLLGAWAVWLCTSRIPLPVPGLHAEPLRWRTGWQPVQLLAASGDGADALTLVLHGWSLPLMLGTFGAIVALAISAGVRPTRSGTNGAAVSAVFGRVLAAGGLAMLVYLADDLLVVALAWLGVRLASAMALRVDVGPAARRQLDDRASVGFVAGLGLVGAVLVGAMAAYNVTDGVFDTSRAAFESILLPVDRQYVVVVVLAFAVVTSLGVAPFHRGWRAAFDHAPSTAATAFAIELGATLHVAWFLGDALAPVAIAELADTSALIFLAAAAWQIAVARIRGTAESTLLALASLATAMCVLGLGLGRTAGLTAASLLGGGAQLGLVVAAAGARRGDEDPERPWLTVAGALAVLGLFPAASYAGVVSLYGGALDDQTSQMRWPELLALAVALLSALCLVSVLRATLLTALDRARPVDEGRDARARVVWLALIALPCVTGVLAGPLASRVIDDAVVLDARRAEARCVGVSGRQIKRAVARERLPVDCTAAHRALRRAYGLHGDGGSSNVEVAGD